MNPPLNTQLTLVELALQPLVASLSHLQSFNGAVVFAKDKHHKNSAGAIASSFALDSSDQRLDFTMNNVVDRRVDLEASILGQTFRTHESKLERSRLYSKHMVWGIYISLPGKQEAVVQLAFDTSAGPTPAVSTLAKAEESHKAEIINALQSIAKINVPSLSDECRLDVPSTPNAFVIKWDIAHSTRHALSDYGDLRHFLTVFEYALQTLVDYHGGKITSFTGDGQNIVLPLPADVDPNDQKAIAAFGRAAVLPLLDKIQRAHSSLATTYDKTIRLNIALGLGHVETSQHGEITGPVFWQLGSKLKTLANASGTIGFAMEDSAKAILQV